MKVASPETRTSCPGISLDTSSGIDVCVASDPAVTSHATSAPGATGRTRDGPPHSRR